MNKKKVLIIAYYFPPLGMGGVQRVTKFAKYLPLFGWRPLVLTVKNVEYMAQDPSLLEELSPEVKVVRTGSFDPLRILYIWRRLWGKRKPKGNSVLKSSGKRSRLSSWLYFPDNKVGWVPFSLFQGLKLYRMEKFDLIYSTSPPPSLHLVGYLLKLLTKTPWIADFRDPWIGYKLETFPTPLHHIFKKKMEKLFLRHADKVIVANPVIEEGFKRKYTPSGKIHLVEQGYDEEDFQNGTDQALGVFTIGYLGTFSPDCNPEPVFTALGELISENKIPRDKIRLVHYGLPLGIDLIVLMEKYNLKNVVLSEGYLSHKEALNEMRKVSVSLLVTSDDPSVFPAKVFEYLRLRKPVIGVVPPESQIAGLLTETGAGKVVSPGDQDGIKKMLLGYFDSFTQGHLGTELNSVNPDRYERKSLSFKLATLFDQTLSKIK
jgi:glycosyltransferase involved in cell wall biosynthesis